MKSRTWASTLTEVMIYCLLLILMLVLAFTFYQLGSRYLAKTRTQVEIQQSASLAVEALIRDLSEAYDGGVVSYAGRLGVGMLSARDAQGKFIYEGATGYPIWQRYVGFYLNPDPEDPQVMALYRSEITNKGGLPTSSPVTPGAAGITVDLFRTQGLRRKLVAHGLVGVDVYSLNAAQQKIYPSVLTNPVWVELELRNLSTGSRQNALITRISVMARN